VSGTTSKSKINLFAVGVVRSHYPPNLPTTLKYTQLYDFFTTLLYFLSFYLQIKKNTISLLRFLE